MPRGVALVDADLRSVEDLLETVEVLHAAEVGVRAASLRQPTVAPLRVTSDDVLFELVDERPSRADSGVGGGEEAAVCRQEFLESGPILGIDLIEQDFLRVGVSPRDHVGRVGEVDLDERAEGGRFDFEHGGSVSDRV